jgi:hypothetical protein
MDISDEESIAIDLVISVVYNAYSSKDRVTL